MAIKTDVLVVGAGPGGYVAAIKLGQLGKKTLLVDKDALGGECLNYGCIPSKALIAAANVKAKFEKAKEIGLDAASISADLSRIKAWKDGVVKGMGRGIASLEKANGVDVLSGAARFTGPKTAEVKTASGAETVEFQHAIISTGSRPLEIPGFEIDGKNVLANKEALALDQVPPRLLVIGGGVIGLEIGTYMAKLGSKVTVVEMLPHILAGIDPELAAPVSRSLAKLGMETILDAKAAGYEPKDGALEVKVLASDGERRIMADKILLSVGRAPNTAGLGLEEAAVTLSPKGFITVDGAYRSSSPHIHAVGDVIGPPFLAHKASREGVLAALAIAGRDAEPIGPIPAAVFTDPEIACVGATVEEAREQGFDPVLGRFPFMASGRAQAGRETDGFVKLVADKATGRLLGGGIVGPGAADLISELCLALRLKATLEDIANTIHPHPTLPEAIQEAAEAALGRPIHILAKR